MSLSDILHYLLIIFFIVGCYNIVTGGVRGSSRIVLLVVLTITFIYLVSSSSLFSRSNNLVQNISSGTSHVSIPNSTISSYKGNYSYSYWFYIDDWNYKYGERKQLLSRDDNNNGFNPQIFLDPMQNDISILISCYSTTPNEPKSTSSNSNVEPSACNNSTNTSSEILPGPSPGSENFICKINNINLQKWVNLIVVLNGRTVDVYLNGKLAKTCMLPGVPRINNESDIEITPGNDPNNKDTNAGFSGYTSNIQFYPIDLTPEDAYNVYKNGFGGNLLGSLLNRYHLTFTFYKDDVETAKLNLI